jgi:hypothetical protein
MLPNPTSLSLSQRATASASAPELFWIGTNEFTSCLWPRPYSSGADASLGGPLDPFVDSVLAATSRIWILDAHFDGPGGYAILRDAFELALEQARDARRALEIHIISGRHRELQVWIAKERIDTKGIDIKGRDGGFHDRYALVDQDLWHFGSTVGGGHCSLSSVSRGWAHHATDFETLFRAWCC